VTLVRLRESVVVIRNLANGQPALYRGSHVQFPWSCGSRLPIWIAGYGLKALRLADEIADGFILQLADPAIA
jgi:alkanesulfonate monooxygenase SsuD/methylene tetrahydromethanopterin reductase-like flavin-dependent oxidoreductase (luciferase family)